MWRQLRWQQYKQSLWAESVGDNLREPCRNPLCCRAQLGNPGTVLEPWRGAVSAALNPLLNTPRAVRTTPLINCFFSEATRNKHPLLLPCRPSPLGWPCSAWGSLQSWSVSCSFDPVSCWNQLAGRSKNRRHDYKIHLQREEWCKHQEQTSIMLHKFILFFK